jgi:DENN (AEX-3) domain
MFSLIQLHYLLCLAVFAFSLFTFALKKSTFVRSLLTTLGPDNSALLLMLALTEQKVLIHSLRYGMVLQLAFLISHIFAPFLVPVHCN